MRCVNNETHRLLCDQIDCNLIEYFICSTPRHKKKKVLLSLLRKWFSLTLINGQISRLSNLQLNGKGVPHKYRFFILRDKFPMKTLNFLMTQWKENKLFVEKKKIK